MTDSELSGIRGFVTHAIWVLFGAPGRASHREQSASQRVRRCCELGSTSYFPLYASTAHPQCRSDEGSWMSTFGPAQTTTTHISAIFRLG